jgi:hypothetical protein
LCFPVCPARSLVRKFVIEFIKCHVLNFPQRQVTWL